MTLRRDQKGTRQSFCRPGFEVLEDRLVLSTLGLVTTLPDIAEAATTPAVVRPSNEGAGQGIAAVVHEILDRGPDNSLPSRVGPEVSAAVHSIHLALRAELGHGNGVGIGLQLNAHHQDKEVASHGSQGPVAATPTPIAIVVSAPSIGSVSLSVSSPADERQDSHEAHTSVVISIAPKGNGAASVQGTAERGTLLVAATSNVKTQSPSASLAAVRVIGEWSESPPHASPVVASAGESGAAPVLVGLAVAADGPRLAAPLADTIGHADFTGMLAQAWPDASMDAVWRLGAMLLDSTNGTFGAAGLEGAGLAVNPEPDARVENVVLEIDLATLEPTGLAPESFGSLSDAAMLNLTAMEDALQQFLDQLDELRQQVGGWLADVGPMPWLLVSLAVAAALHEGVRRRWRHVRDQDALRWSPALNGPVEGL